jgi:hypothetical protein
VGCGGLGHGGFQEGFVVAAGFNEFFVEGYEVVYSGLIYCYLKARRPQKRGEMYLSFGSIFR